MLLATDRVRIGTVNVMVTLGTGGATPKGSSYASGSGDTREIASPPSPPGAAVYVISTSSEVCITRNTLAVD